MRKTRALFTHLMILGTLVACRTTPPPLSPAESLRPGPSPQYRDDLGLPSLRVSLEDHIGFFRARPGLLAQSLQFGATSVGVESYVQALEQLLVQVPRNQNEDPEPFFRYLKERFTCFEVHGDGRWGEAFITSYFDPVIGASSRPTAEHYRPVYGVPRDMVLIQLGEFRRVFPHWSAFQITEQKSATPTARGRLFQRKGVKFVAPYYSRYELDQLGLLRGQGLELAYADPMDIFVMQIQGSGTLELENGSLFRVGYAAQNGQPYVPIGKLLKDKIPAEEMSLQSIERVARSLPPEEFQALLDQNPSYVFFQALKGEPLTTLGTPVRPGRTIATDRGHFPKGALAFLQFKKPLFSSSTAVQPERWEEVGRLVMDQDTGGAIRGTGRLDLYWGRGASAKQVAGVMKQWGKLCYLVPR